MSNFPLPSSGSPTSADLVKFSRRRQTILTALAMTADAVSRIGDAAAVALDVPLPTDYLKAQLHHAMNGLMKAWTELHLAQADGDGERAEELPQLDDEPPTVILESSPVADVEGGAK